MVWVRAESSQEFRPLVMPVHAVTPNDQQPHAGCGSGECCYMNRRSLEQEIPRFGFRTNHPGILVLALARQFVVLY